MEAMTPFEEATKAAQVAAAVLAKRLDRVKVRRHVKAKNIEWQQFYVNFLPGYSNKAVRLLLDGVKHRRFRRYTTPSSPEGGAQVAVVKCGAVKVRAVAQYRIATDQTLLRLDVIGARA